MDNLFLMDIRESFQNSPQNFNFLLLIIEASIDELPQVRPVAELHRDV